MGEKKKENRSVVYLTFPMYPRFDLDMLSAFSEMMYSVHVLFLLRFAEKRNFPFSTTNAANVTKFLCNHYKKLIFIVHNTIISTLLLLKDIFNHRKRLY